MTGYCGTAEANCGTGCQASFGKCNSTPLLKVTGRLTWNSFEKGKAMIK
jgi:hypothetical protein